MVTCGDTLPKFRSARPVRSLSLSYRVYVIQVPCGHFGPLRFQKMFGMFCESAGQFLTFAGER